MKILRILPFILILLFVVGCVKTTTVTTPNQNEQVYEPVADTVSDDEKKVVILEESDDVIVDLGQTGSTTEIDIDAGGFKPKQVIIEVGDSVLFRNVDVDADDHRIMVDGLFDSEDFSLGKTFRYTFDMPGSYEVREVNTGKRGVVIVLE